MRLSVIKKITVYSLSACAILSMTINTMPIYANESDSGVNNSLNINDVLEPQVYDGGYRYEVKGNIGCEQGVSVQLPEFVQSSLRNPNDEYSWGIGRPKNFAPFIWLTKTQDGSYSVSLTSAATANWVFCNDDGDTFYRSKNYFFDTLYSVTATGDNIALERIGYLQMHTQTAPRSIADQNLGMLITDISDAQFIHKDPAIDGPYDFSIYSTPKSLSIGIHKSSSTENVLSFDAVFPNGCGEAKPLKVTYTRSDCEEYNCSDLPN
ncbi:MAG: hypothetical protein NT027_17400 [Proteobacteria bacterium]|nr:hypothetical protein [Pseudomonadota bacterium]